MFCKHCGKQLSDTAKFCPKCGTKMVYSPDAGSAGGHISDKSLRGTAKGVIPDTIPVKKKKSKLPVAVLVCGIVAVILVALACFALFGGKFVSLKKEADVKSESGMDDWDEDDMDDSDEDEVLSDKKKARKSETETEETKTAAAEETETAVAAAIEYTTEAEPAAAEDTEYPAPMETAPAAAKAAVEETAAEVSVYAGSLGKKDAAAETETETKAKETKAQETKAAVKNGWLKEGGNWYYYKAGQKATGWLQDGGKWYYLESNGRMFSGGWKTISGYSYYFGADGAMYCNAVTPDGSIVDGEGHKVESSVASGDVLTGTFRYEDTVYDETEEMDVDAKVVLNLKETGSYTITIWKGSQKLTESGKYKYSEDEEYIKFTGRLISNGYCNGYLIETSVKLLGDVCLE